MDMKSEESDHRRKPFQLDKRKASGFVFPENQEKSTTSEEPDSTSVARTFILWLVRLFYPAFYATKPWIIPKVQILFSNHKQG
ncbi:uncharacterized protein [Macaca nemestrina]|uniref:uncharacterized protein isoform X5 n=1 Tax=Macaca nemestrina TaxID=9545 RepID=UPI0032B0336D